jgi:hypothetical protein
MQETPAMTNQSLDRVSLPLKLCYGLVPIVAGVDKFTDLLCDWSKYLPSFVTKIVPVAPHQFMMIVGVIEIVAGIIVLSKLTRLGATVVAAWLVLIALNVAIAGYFDIAVRDLVMALGGYTLAALAAMRGEALIPGRLAGRQAVGPEPRHA